MCKHVAATLYGRRRAGSTTNPSCLFPSSKVDHLELIEEAVSGAGKQAKTTKKTLVESDIAGVFGID